MASELRRRHAWVVTGTPVNSSIKELEGLLSFLGSRPFAEQSVFGALVHNAFKACRASNISPLTTDDWLALAVALAMARTHSPPLSLLTE